MTLNVFSVYAPQVGCQKRGRKFAVSWMKWARGVIGADFKGHVGEGKRSYKLGRG